MTANAPHDGGMEEFLKAIASAQLDDSMTEFLHNSERENDFCRAVSEGDINVVSRMLREGQSPNSSSDFDFTYASALERAVNGSHSMLVSMLFDAHADPTLNKFDGAFMSMAVVHGAQAPEYLEGFPGPGDDGNASSLPGFAGLFAILNAKCPFEHPSDADNQVGLVDMDTMKWIETRHVLKYHRRSAHWKTFRCGFKMRCIAMFWLGIAMQEQCAEGGQGRADDIAALRSFQVGNSD